jgi:hypothetical protein
MRMDKPCDALCRAKGRSHLLDRLIGNGIHPRGQYPMLHLREQKGGHWAFSGDFTQTYLEVLREIGTDGLALQNKVRNVGPTLSDWVACG